MASYSGPSSIRDFQNILFTAHSISSAIGLPLITPGPSTCGIIEEDAALPPPPSIDNILSRLHLPPNSYAKFLAMYEDSASQFRRFSERKLRHAINACAQINRQKGLPPYDSHLIRAASAEFYSRTIKSMQCTIVTLCQKSATRSAPPVIIPRCLSLPHSWPISSHGSTRVIRNQPVVDVKLSQPSIKTLDEPHYPLMDVQPVSFSSLQRREDFFRSPRDITPIYKSGGNARDNTNVEQDHFLHEHASTSYPTRYTHVRPVAAQNFTSDSFDFFPDTGDHEQPCSSIPEVMGGITTTLLAALNGLHLHGRAVKSPSTSTSSRLGDRPTNQKNSRQISLDISTVKETSHSTRKCHSLPKLRSLSPSNNQEAPHLSAMTAMTATSLAPARVSQPVDAISPDIVPSPTKPGMRRRKLKPLPRRVPTTASCTIPFAPTPSRYQNKNSSSTSISTSYPSQPPPLASMSRTPSLVSLSSSRPASPCSTDGALDTPPPSPPLRATDVAGSTLNCKGPYCDALSFSPVGERDADSYSSTVNPCHSRMEGHQMIISGPVAKEEDLL